MQSEYNINIVNEAFRYGANRLLDIAYMPFQSYISGKSSFLNIVNTRVWKRLLLNYYNTKVYRGDIIPIEKLPTEDKMKLWELTKEFPNKETRIEACKIYWAMEYMAAKKLKNESTNSL